MIEIWKDIPGYEGIYFASSFGRIQSIYKGIKNTYNRVGYKAVSLHKKGKSKKFYVHRLVALSFIPNPQNKPQVNHKDGNKQNNHLLNLEWVTISENAIHAMQTGLTKIRRGEETTYNKLMTEQVTQICEELNKGISCKKLAKRYGLTHSAISLIKRNKRWTHISKNIIWAKTKQQCKPMKIQDNFGKIYKSLTEAAKYNNLSIGNVSMVLNGIRKQTKGLKFFKIGE